MAGISTMGTTYNLPNYVGDLFSLTPTDTPVLSAIGGLTGGISSNGDIEHSWQTYDLRDAGDKQQLEGQDPSSTGRVRANVSNLLEIHQEGVSISYTQQAAVNNTSGDAQGSGSNPVTDEIGWQIQQQIKQAARDVEWSFIRGRYFKPTTNADPRRTRGLLQAVPNANITVVNDGAKETYAATESDDKFTKSATGLANGNLVAVFDIDDEEGGVLPGVYYVVNKATNDVKLSLTAGGDPISVEADFSCSIVKVKAADKSNVIDAIQAVWDAGGLQETEAATLVTNSGGKRLLTDKFITGANYQEQSRNVGGVRVTTIETDFGTLNVMLNRYMPAGAMLITSLDQCSPVFLEIPGKGHFFVEQLAQTGAQVKAQLYGEIGLKYGNPNAHGLLLGSF